MRQSFNFQSQWDHQDNPGQRQLTIFKSFRLDHHNGKWSGGLSQINYYLFSVNNLYGIWQMDTFAIFNLLMSAMIPCFLSNKA